MLGLMEMGRFVHRSRISHNDRVDKTYKSCNLFRTLVALMLNDRCLLSYSISSKPASALHGRPWRMKVYTLQNILAWKTLNLS